MTISSILVTFVRLVGVVLWLASIFLPLKSVVAVTVVLDVVPEG